MTNTYAVERRRTLAGISRHARAVMPILQSSLGFSACTCGDTFTDVASLNTHVITAPRNDYVREIKRSTVKQDAPGEWWRYYCAICRWWSAGEASEMGARNTGADHRAIHHP